MAHAGCIACTGSVLPISKPFSRKPNNASAFLEQRSSIRNCTSLHIYECFRPYSICRLAFTPTGLLRIMSDSYIGLYFLFGRILNRLFLYLTGYTTELFEIWLAHRTLPHFIQNANRIHLRLRERLLIAECVSV